MSTDLLPTYQTFLERDVAAGLSDRAIGDKLGVSERTVLRWRKRLGLASQWTPPLTAVCGDLARYQRGCRCELCRAANVREHTAYVRRLNAASTPTNDRKHWTPEEDAILLDDTRGTMFQRARELGRTYGAACERKSLIRRRSRS